MPNYQVTVTVNVPDVEADSEEEAIKEVETEIASVFAEPVRFYSQTAIDYEAGFAQSDMIRDLTT